MLLIAEVGDGAVIVAELNSKLGVAIAPPHVARVVSTSLCMGSTGLKTCLEPDEGLAKETKDRQA
jgi:hypothetical protein